MGPKPCSLPPGSVYLQVLEHERDLRLPLFLLGLFARYSPCMLVKLVLSATMRSRKEVRESKLTISCPFLLWRALPSQLRDL
jgi:hypothetical protein